MYVIDPKRCLLAICPGQTRIEPSGVKTRGTTIVSSGGKYSRILGHLMFELKLVPWCDICLYPGHACFENPHETKVRLRRDKKPRDSCQASAKERNVRVWNPVGGTGTTCTQHQRHAGLDEAYFSLSSELNRGGVQSHSVMPLI